MLEPRNEPFLIEIEVLLQPTVPSCKDPETTKMATSSTEALDTGRENDRRYPAACNGKTFLRDESKTGSV